MTDSERDRNILIIHQILQLRKGFGNRARPKLSLLRLVRRLLYPRGRLPPIALPPGLRRLGPAPGWRLRACLCSSRAHLPRGCPKPDSEYRPARLTVETRRQVDIGRRETQQHSENSNDVAQCSGTFLSGGHASEQPTIQANLSITQRARPKKASGERFR